VKLEQQLKGLGICVLHSRKVIEEKAGKAALSDGSSIPASLCVWTLGLQPNPVLTDLGLPLTSDGQVVTDPSYRVPGMPGVNCIGDCAQIIDPTNGRADRKTCKEAAAQANRLGKILLAIEEGRRAPLHKESFVL